MESTNFGITISADKYTHKDRSIKIEGCWSFEVENTGDVTAYVFNTVVIEPGETRSFPNVGLMPYTGPCNLSFQANSGTRSVQVIKAKKVPVKPCD